ncbi:MAG: ABC transporter permease [Nocardioidaceae bacterium]
MFSKLLDASYGRGARRLLLRSASILLLLGGWSVVAAAIGTDIVPAPWNVYDSLAQLISSGFFAAPLAKTLYRTLICFLCGIGFALLYGIAAARSPWFNRLSRGLFIVVLFAPSLVIIFIVLAIFSTHMVLALALIAAAAVSPALAVYVRDAMTALDHDILSMADSYHVGVVQRARHIYLPHLIPTLLTVSRVGFTHSWKMVMLAEIFGLPGGLGFFLRSSYTAYDLPQVLSWLVIFVTVLLAIEQGLRYGEGRLVKWR